MNRNLDRLIHVDISAEHFGADNVENCLFSENESLFDLTERILDIIEKSPVNVRPFLTTPAVDQTSPPIPVSA